jgi:hypothetical protein
MVRKAVALLYIVLGIVGVYALLLYAPVFLGNSIGSIDTLEEGYVLIFNVPTVLILFAVPLSLVVIGVISVLRRATDLSPLVNLLFLIPLLFIMVVSIALPVAVLESDVVREALQAFISNVHL